MSCVAVCKVVKTKQDLEQACSKEKLSHDTISNSEKLHRESIRDKVFKASADRLRRETAHGASQIPENIDSEVREILEFEDKYGDLESAWTRFEKRAMSEAFVITLDEVPFVTRSLLRRLLPNHEERQTKFKRLAKRCLGSN